MEKQNIDGLWTTKILMGYLKVSESTVEKLRQNGLPFVQLGGIIRYRRESVEAYVKENERTCKEAVTN